MINDDVQVLRDDIRVLRLEDAIRLRTKWELAALNAADDHERHGNITDRDAALDRAAEHVRVRDELNARRKNLKEGQDA